MCSIDDDGLFIEESKILINENHNQKYAENYVDYLNFVNTLIGLIYARNVD